MRASILKRLEALEQAVNRHARPQLRFVDVLQFSDDDRDAYWDGDEAVLSRYAPDLPDLPSDIIHTVVVSLNRDSRDAWEATRHLTDDELDAYNDALIQESQRKAPNPVPEPKQEPRFDQWGYQIY